MKIGVRRASLGAGAMATVVVLLMLMPTSAGTNVPSAPGAKTGALGLAGHLATLRPLASPHGRAGGAGTSYIRLDRAPTVGTGAGAAPSAVATPPVSAPAPNPTSPQLLSSFTGTGQTTSTSWLQPDPAVAVGGSYALELTNEYGRVTSTNGSHVYSHFTLQSFFGTAKNDSVYGPQALFDPMSGRWYVTAIDLTTNTIELGVSKTGSPIGAWWMYTLTVFFGGVGTFSFHARIGASKSMFAVTTGQFNSTSSFFYASILTFINKPKLESGNFTFEVLASSAQSITPARQLTTNGSGTDVLYFASTNVAAGSTTLLEYEASGPIGTVALSAVVYTIHATGTVPNAPQAGTTVSLALGDDSVSSASWSSAGILWVSFSTACLPTGDSTLRACLRVDGINTASNVLVQDSKVGVAGEYLFDGALTALTTGVGYLMVMQYSGPALYPGIAMAGQNVTDSYGSVRGPIPAFNGPSYDPYGYVGDDSSIQLGAGSGKVTVWAASEYLGTTGWGTEILHFSFY